MLALRRHKRVSTWLGLLALLSNVLAVAVFAPAKMAPLFDELLGALVICTSDGAKTLGQSDGRAPHRGAAEHCPACTLVAQVALAITAILGIFAFPTPISVKPPLPVRSRAPATYLRLGGIGSRAPPLFA
jgi:hypothetical protein